MQMHGESVHGERFIDGDASALTVLTLYKDGTTTVRALAADEFLYITDIRITMEFSGDYALVADSEAGGRYIAWGHNDASVVEIPTVLHFITPYCCPKGVIPKFSGSTQDRNFCMIQGFITKA